MKAFRILILFTVIPLLLIACSKESEPVVNKECNIDIDSIDFSFGIDYYDKEKYLIPGEEVRSAIGTPGNDIEGILLVCHWINQNFTFDNAGGAMADLPNSGRT